MLVSVIFFGVVMVFLVLSFSLRSKYSSPEGDDSNTYASRDMTLISYSRQFCNRLSLQGNYQSEKVVSTLYFLNHIPPTTRKELISFSQEPVLFHSYHYWMFHLLPSSKIQLTACLKSGSTAYTTFYLVKGSKSFANWKSDESSSTTVMKHVNELCSSEMKKHIFLDYTVQKEDQYYMVFESEYISASLKLTFNITQVLYNITQDMVVSKCSIDLSTHNSCDLPVSLAHSRPAMLVLEPQTSSQIDWEANNVVEVHCHARVWLYMVVCLTAVLVIIAIILIIAVVICVRRRRKRTNATAATTGTSTTGNSSTIIYNQGADVLPSAPSQPEDTPLLFGLQQQERQDPPPKYNDTFEAPPAYKP